MLNKGLNSEEVQSLKFRVQRNETNLKSASGVQRHPVGQLTDSGSDALGSMLQALCYSSPQNLIAYETCLTKFYFGWSSKGTNCFSGIVPVNANLDPLNPPKGDNSSPSVDGRLGGVRITDPNYSCHNTNNLNDPTQIVLNVTYTNCSTKCCKANFVVTMVNADRLKKEVPILRDDYFEAHRYTQTQTERKNNNKNRIDKQLKPNCRSTNNKNTFCELEKNVNLKKILSYLSRPARQEQEFLPLKRGSVPTEALGKGVVFNT